MFKKIKNILYLLSFFLFIFFTTSFYFSDKNINKTNKSRTSFLVKQKVDLTTLPVLENDTDNIIEYRDDMEIFKKNKKNYTFWCLIKKCEEKQ